MLKTERLLLRRAKAEDLHDLYAMLSDPRAMAYWSTAPHDTCELTREHLNKMINAPGPLTYFIWERNGKMIGMGGLHRDTEIGFMVHPDHWRHGYAREAMQAIIPNLWATTKTPELMADVDPLNTASMGLLAALGFHETHRAKNTFCIDGKWSDSAYLTLARPS